MQGMHDATRQTMAKIRSNLPRFTRARLYLFVFVLVQSPVAYTPGLKVKGPLAKQPIVPLQAVARDLREARDGTVRNATIAEHVVSLAALPGNLVRMSNLTAPNGTRPNVTYELERAITLASARTLWWPDMKSRHWLIVASKLVCVGGILLPACGRGNAHAWVMLSGFAWLGLIAMGAIAIQNRGLPTPQAGLAFVAASFEVRGAWRLMLFGGPAELAAPPSGSSSSAAGKKKKKA
jgi:hypothetical protein